MKSLYKLTELVENLLTKFPDTRNSDNLLYYYVIKDIGRSKNVDIDNMSLPMFLLHMKDYGLPSIESVGRARRKCVEKNPKLAGSETVQVGRELKETEYRRYARGGRYGRA